MSILTVEQFTLAVPDLDGAIGAARNNFSAIMTELDFANRSNMALKVDRHIIAELPKLDCAISAS